MVSDPSPSAWRHVRIVRRPSRARTRLLLVGTLAALAAACNRHEAPKGQVVARVNGVEITVAELNEEARSRGLPIGDDPALKGALVQELADRKLLVAKALDEGVDRQPAFLLAKRRSDEILLAQQLLAGATEGGSVSEEQLRRYIAAQPDAFDRRVLMAVDQLNISGAVTPGLRQALAATPNVERMEQLAAAARLSFARSRETLDSANPADQRSRALLGHKPGETFLVPQPGGLIVGKIVSVTPSPVPPAQQLQVARERLQRDRTQAALDRLLGQLRPSARIHYQPGFAPTASGR